MFLSFQNPGLIDPLAITTLGASVKEGPSPIGFFGTGLKYSIAGVLRLGGVIKIYRGLEPFLFEARAVEIRNQKFSLVHMNGAPLGFTTDYGKHWEPWMLYRELYCNAKDEGGTASDKNLPPREGFTTIHVISQPLFTVHLSRGLYFLETPPSWASQSIEVHNRQGSHIFYRGVRVGMLSDPARFTYNILKETRLTEDRTLPYFSFNADIAEVLYTSADRDFIRQFLTSPAKSFESKIDLNWEWLSPGELFLSTAAELYRTHKLTNPSILPLLRKRDMIKEYEEYDLSSTEVLDFQLACEIAEDLDFRVSSYPILIVKSLPSDALGLARDGKIYLSRRAFEDGLPCLIATLIEEYVHLEHGYDDFTRELQDLFLRRLVHWGRRAIGK